MTYSSSRCSTQMRWKSKKPHDLIKREERKVEPFVGEKWNEATTNPRVRRGLIESCSRFSILVEPPRREGSQREAKHWTSDSPRTATGASRSIQRHPQLMRRGSPTTHERCNSIATSVHDHVK